MMKAPFNTFYDSKEAMYLDRLELESAGWRKVCGLL